MKLKQYRGRKTMLSVAAILALIGRQTARASLDLVETSGSQASNDGDLTWNYEKGGDDWDFPNCNVAQQQSPVDLLSPGRDWWSPVSGQPFVFLPSFRAGIPTKSLVENYTQTFYGDFGTFIATEPSDYTATQAIKWNSKYIKFHYPAEHSYNGEQYDAEMQIYHQEDYPARAVCVSGIGILSVFFKISKEVPPVDNPLLAFLTDNLQPVDLNLLFPIDVSLSNFILGYVGTKTSPNCDRGHCWYFLRTPQSISPAQFEKIKVAGVTKNSRNVHDHMPSYKQYDAQGMLYVPPTPPPTPPLSSDL